MAGRMGTVAGFVPPAEATGLTRLARRLALPAVAAAAICTAAYTSVVIMDKQAALRSTSRYNLTWLASQAATELARLEERVAARTMPGSGVDTGEVQLRLDMLANRSTLLKRGQIRDFIREQPEMGVIVQSLADVVARAQPLVDRLDEGPEDDVARELLELLAPLDSELSRLASAASGYAGTKVDEDQNSLSQLHWILSGMLIGLLGCGLALLAMLARNRRDLERANMETRALAEGLQRTGEDLRAANGTATAANEELLRRNDALGRRDREIAEQARRFQAALDNMSQALCMVGPGQDVIVCNRRYLEMFGVDEGIVRPGAEMSEVWRAVAGAGKYPRALVEEVLHRQHGLIGTGGPASFHQEDPDGRAVGVSHQPMGDGGWVATYEDVTDRLRAASRISWMAHHDALTGLPNRVLFRERMEAELEALERSGGSLALFCLDLDHFKTVNDTLGHHVGDELLEQVAQRLRECVRGGDVVARLGGDEFAVMQVGSRQPEAAESLGHRLVEVIGLPYDLSLGRVEVGVSGGVTLAPGDGTSGARLLRNADMALYEAKGSGRSHIEFYEPRMEEALRARRQMERELALAVERDEFEVHYHPLVSLRTDAVTGFEALVRWRHPERGMVAPTEFIPVAEEVGLISKIGEFVLRRACADAMRWPGHIKVAVNLSSAQFRDPGLVTMVADVLAREGMEPHRLELEVTESIVLEDSATNVQTLTNLHGLGVRISMDDFGTGYSSLSYLRKFPFDKIKIDQSFVRGIVDDTDCVAIVTSIASLAVDLGMTTTAEGVESAEHLRLVREAGCTEVQGYLFGRPMPFDLANLAGTPCGPS